MRSSRSMKVDEAVIPSQDTFPRRVLLSVPGDVFALRTEGGKVCTHSSTT